jgi:hypothetical protein
MMKFSHIGIAAFALALSGSTTFAAGLRDGSFEKPHEPSNTQQIIGAGGKVGPWTVIGVGNVAVIGPDYIVDGLSLQAKNGLQLLNLAGDQHSQPGIEQTFKTVAGTHYMLWFNVGSIYDVDHGFGRRSTVVVKINGDSTGSYTTVSQGSKNEVTWGKFGVGFTATGTKTTIDISNGDEANDGFCGLDGVSVRLDTTP